MFCNRLVDGERHTVEIKRCKMNAAKNINLFFIYFFRGTQEGGAIEAGYELCVEASESL